MKNSSPVDMLSWVICYFFFLFFLFIAGSAIYVTVFGGFQ